MKRGHLISAVVLLSALAAAGALVGTTAVAPATAQEANASITFNDQTATETVTVESATLPDGGFVVVYNSSGAVVGNSTTLESGTHENVSVTVAPPLERSGVYIAEVHHDNDSDGAFNATTDVAYNTSTGNAVSSTAYITVEGADDGTGEGTATNTETVTVELNETDETTSASDTTSPVDATDADGTETNTGTPGFTVVAAVVALLGAALLARRS